MIIEQIKKDLIVAQKNKEASKLLVLRSILSELKNTEIAIRTENKILDDELSLIAIKKEAKKRTESIQIYKEAGRLELAEIEEAELKIINEYLPSQLSPEELEKIISQYIENNKSPQIGEIMKYLKSSLGQTFDGKTAAQIAQKLIN